MVTRRELLRAAARLGAIAYVGGPLLYRSPLFASGPNTRVNVRDYGARGDGSTDDTAAFARAVRAVAGGGTIHVPAGTYRIDPRRSVALSSGMTLEMDNAAALVALPVAAASSAVVLTVGATHVTVKGGTIVGERAGHLGTRGEWGMGIKILGGSDIRLQNVTIRDCWGDGIYVGIDRHGQARRVTISHCTSLNNRRQGLSIVGCIDALVEDSTFSNTQGTKPQGGIDLEPNRGGLVRNVTIRRCEVSHNAGYGIVLSAHAAPVTGVRVERNVCVGNNVGITVSGATDCTVTRNEVDGNRTIGILLMRAKNDLVSENRISENSQGQPLGWPNVSIERGSTDNTISNNTFGGPTDVSRGPRYDISVAPGCTGNRLIDNSLRAERHVPAVGQLGGIRNDGLRTLMRGNH